MQRVVALQIWHTDSLGEGQHKHADVSFSPIASFSPGEILPPQYVTRPTQPLGSEFLGEADSWIATTTLLPVILQRHLASRPPKLDAAFASRLV